MADSSVEDAMREAVRWHRAGELLSAERAYRQVLAAEPGHGEALHGLGLIVHQAGRCEEAVGLIRRAVAGRPEWTEAYYNLGVALKDAGRWEEAIEAFGRAIEQRPGFAEAYGNLGTVLASRGRGAEAAEAFARVVALQPTAGRAHNNLGVVLSELGRAEQAIAAFREAIAVTPSFPEAHNNLGNALKQVGRRDEAVAAYRQAIALRPGFAEAMNNLGVGLQESGKWDEAIAVYQQAIAVRPRFPEALNNLGVALHEQRQPDPAIAAYRRAIELRPAYAEAHYNLGNALKDRGEWAEAVAAYRHALLLQPGLVKAHTNLVYVLHFQADARTIAEEQRRWSDRHAEPLPRFPARRDDRGPKRRLRVGYVSPDFRAHPVGRFLLPLLSHHDRSEFEIFAYSDVARPDATTGLLRSHVDHWNSIVGMSDAAAADVIYQDEIDLLIDLTMHMAHNRLLVFARKPAAVQATWLAYPGSTGLRTIDYRLSDPYLDPAAPAPAGATTEFYTEETVRLPTCYWCYQPDPACGEVGPLPALSAGYVTFGCLNNFCKVGEPTLAAWAMLLATVPGARLLLYAPPGESRRRVGARFGEAGVEPERIAFVGKRPTGDYFQQYHRIDIALDTFPYGGGTTTCDALWMGVPVVSLVGSTAVGRGGLSILSNVGLAELLAGSVEEYVAIARGLGEDLPRLNDLRFGLRERMRNSPLLNAPRFAREMESAFGHMGRR